MDTITVQLFLYTAFPIDREAAVPISSPSHTYDSSRTTNSPNLLSPLPGRLARSACVLSVAVCYTIRSAMDSLSLYVSRALLANIVSFGKRRSCFVIGSVHICEGTRVQLAVSAVAVCICIGVLWPACIYLPFRPLRSLRLRPPPSVSAPRAPSLDPPLRQTSATLGPARTQFVSHGHEIASLLCSKPLRRRVVWCSFGRERVKHLSSRASPSGQSAWPAAAAATTAALARAPARSGVCLRAG